MSVSHPHRIHASHSAAQQKELETLLASQQFSQAVSAYDRTDCEHDVPYVGGSGTDWRTIYWDRHLCAAIDAAEFRVNGKPIDPRVTGKVHEAVEGAIIHLWPLAVQLLGWPQDAPKYARAHMVADMAERHAVEHMGWPWAAYQAGWKPFIRTEEHESIVKPPVNLLLEPYRGTKLYSRLATFQVGRFSDAMRNARQAPDGHLYAPDHNRPGKYVRVHVGTRAG